MTLIIAADVQDHLILAGDRCAVLSSMSNREKLDVVLRNYQKVYPWKYGAIAASGDVVLMVNFWRNFLLHEGLGQPINLAQVAREAKAARTRVGIPPSQSTGNVFFTLPGRDGFELHGLFFGERTVECEIITPIEARLSMQAHRAPVQATCHAFASRLRPSLFFDDITAFHRHHLDLFGRFFAEQSVVDDRVTSSCDVFMLDKRSGRGLFWTTPGAVTMLT